MDRRAFLKWLPTLVLAPLGLASCNPVPIGVAEKSPAVVEEVIPLRLQLSWDEKKGWKTTQRIEKEGGETVLVSNFKFRKINHEKN